MTRGQLSRHQRELQQKRYLDLAMAGVGVLVVLILRPWSRDQFVIRPKPRVGKVNDQTITRAMYNKFRAWDLYNQMRVLEFYCPAGADATQATQYQTQISRSSRTELESLDNGRPWMRHTLATGR